MQSWGWELHHPPPRAAQAAGQASQEMKDQEKSATQESAKGGAESNRTVLPHSWINNSICSRAGSLCHFTKQKENPPSMPALGVLQTEWKTPQMQHKGLRTGKQKLFWKLTF